MNIRKIERMPLAVNVVQSGVAVATSLTPFLATRLGWQTAFFTAAGLAVSGALLWFLVDPTQSLISRTNVPEPTLQ